MNPALLAAYFHAFKKSNLNKRRTRDGRLITQKVLAKTCGLREADFTAVFRHINNVGGNVTSPSPKQEMNVLNCLENYWEINDKGYLVEQGLELTEEERKKDETKDEKLPIWDLSVSPCIHRDYKSAQIGKAVVAGGDSVMIINTYLPNYIFNPEATEGDQETLGHWLKKGKKVKILLLHPERNGMRLRAQSLNMSGEELANYLVSALNRLLENIQKYPNQIEVRLMDEIPGVSAVILETRLFYGLHLSNGHTENGQYTEVAEGSDLYASIRKHFETLWDPRRSIQLTDDLVKNTENALHGVRNQLNYLSEGGGKWNLYLHDISGMLEGLKPAPSQSSVGEIIRWDLKIFRPERGITLSADLSLSTTGQSLGPARLVTERITGQDYCHLRFTNFKDLSIHLTFRCPNERDSGHLGFYTLVSRGNECSSGYIVLLKDEGTQADVRSLTPYFRRLLAFRDSSYISLKRVDHEKDLFGPKMRYAGTYRIYSYGGKRGEGKGIKMNWLHIDEVGMARYKNQHFTKGKELIGQATYLNLNLYLVFTGFEEDGRQRLRGYTIVKVGQEDPKVGSFYGGVNLGVSLSRYHMPNGKRFILEYMGSEDFDQVEPKFMLLHSTEYCDIPKPIRSLLSGRLKNLNGFLRTGGQIFNLHDLDEEWRNSIRLDQVFYDSAVQHARRERYEEAVKMLFRAVNHGLNKLEDFENEILAFSPDGLRKMQKEKDYQKIRNVLTQSTSSHLANGATS